MLTMYQQITVKTLANQGKKQGEIARELSCHRNTVSNILARADVLQKQTRSKPSYFDAYKDRIKELLEGKEKLTRLRIFEIIQEEYHTDRPYITLCKYMERTFGKKKEAYVVQETEPGEEAEVDFGYLGRLSAPDGTIKKTWGFAMVLSHSRKGFYTEVYDQSVETFIACHTEAFVYLGGVPKRVKVDNLKAAVLKNRRYDLEMNETFLLFSYHYSFVVVPCTPYEPWEKGKVERGVDYLKENFVAGRKFADHVDLKRQLNDWMNNKANKRIHGTTKRVPDEVFLLEEKHLLQSLPDTPFTYTPSLTRIVGADCHVTYEKRYYSVPAKYVGETVAVRKNGELVKIFFGAEEIACHAFSHVVGIHVTEHVHYPPYKIYSQTGYQAKYEDKMRIIGETAHTFFCRVVSEDPKGWVKTVRKVLGVAHTYGNEKTDKALRRALAYGALSGVVIERICAKGLEDAPIEPYLLQGCTQSMQEKTDGLVRELTYYASVPLSGASVMDTGISGSFSGVEAEKQGTVAHVSGPDMSRMIHPPHTIDGSTTV